MAESKNDYDNIQNYILTLNKAVNLSYGNQKETFAIGGVDGKGIISENTTIDVSQRDYFKEVFEDDVEYAISKPLISKSDKNPIFIICTPITDYENNKIGFINGAVSLSKLTSITENIGFNNGFMWIMTNDFDSYTLSNEDLYRDHISKSELEKLSFNMDAQSSGNFRVTNAFGEKSTLFYATVPFTENWILCHLIKDNLLYKNTNQIISYLIVYAFVLLFISIFVGILLSKSITTPMEKLKENMIKVSKGNMDINSNLATKDEIQVLGDVFYNMVIDLNASIETSNLLQKEKRDAEFKTLQSQINPHFLYNTLDTISWKALEYPNKEVYNMVSSLSDFFRVALSEGKDFISISEEVVHVKSYLDIQKIRYKNKLDYTIFLGKGLEDAQIMKMILQPIVENSIYHGLKDKKYIGKVKISIVRVNDTILINIFDNGIGMEQTKIDALLSNLKNTAPHENYGLYNINQRLRLIYDDNYTLEIRSEYLQYTLFTFRLPYVPLVKGGDDRNA